MLTPDDAQLLTEAVTGLAAPLHDGLAKGQLLSHEYFDKHGMTGPAHTRGRTDLAREHARHYLYNLGDLGGWKIANSASGRIHLWNDLLTCKVLHGSPFDNNPAPGTNRARISYYRNPRLDLLGAKASNLLAVWLTDPKTGELTIRIVRPIGNWKYRRNPKVDLDFVLPRSAEDFGEWQFVPDDEGLSLPFVFDEDDQREERGSGA